MNAAGARRIEEAPRRGHAGNEDLPRLPLRHAGCGDPPRDGQLLFVLAAAGEEVWVTIEEANGCFDFFDFLRGLQTVG